MIHGEQPDCMCDECGKYFEGWLSIVLQTTPTNADKRIIHLKHFLVVKLIKITDAVQNISLRFTSRLVMKITH